MKRPYEYGNEVARAVAANAPVVALETTVRLHFSLGFGTGVLVANPIPSADEMPSELYDRAVQGPSLRPKRAVSAAAQ